MSEVETNVRVAKSVLASLSKIQQRRGIRSRAQTLRQVLENYVAAQMRFEPDLIRRSVGDCRLVGVSPVEPGGCFVMVTLLCEVVCQSSYRHEVPGFGRAA